MREEQWAIYEVGDEYVLEVHVVPHHDDYTHEVTTQCECMPTVEKANRSEDVNVVIHNVVYYN